MKRTNLILNFDKLSKENITIDEFLFLYKLYINTKYNDNTIDKNKLQNKILIKCINDKYNILLRRGKELIESQLVKDENNIDDTPTYDQIDDFIEVYRKKWKGLAPGLMGSPKACKDKLTTWIENNPKYSFDDILMAVDLYLRSVNNPKYIQRADYFISKMEKGVELSRLSAFIEEIDNYTEENWTNELN